MNNFNSPFMGYGFNRNVPPLFYPRINRINKVVQGTSSFSRMLNKAQSGINTLNQIIPLYKQVKPLYGDVKSFAKSIKGFVSKSQEKIDKFTKSSSFAARKNMEESSPFFY